MHDVADISPVEAWDMLKNDPKAQLVDVRTAAEWNFVGMPDLAPLGRSVVTVEWSQYPNMARNEQFEAQVAGKLTAQGAGTDTPIVFLCRSGARSLAAAKAMTAAGFKRCFNIAGGFEGDLDLQKHRGQQNGWKSAGLGWKQT